MTSARRSYGWPTSERARELLLQHGVREIDRTDGFFLAFDRVADAASFALRSDVESFSIASCVFAGISGSESCREI